MPELNPVVADAVLPVDKRVVGFITRGVIYGVNIAVTDDASGKVNVIVDVVNENTEPIVGQA